MSINVRIPGGRESIAALQTFDHLGREIKLGGYRGGRQFLTSTRLSNLSLTSIALAAGVELDTAAAGHVVTGGSFGERGDRAVRRAHG